MVKCAKHHGGLGIRDPELMNKAMGTKMIWRLISGRRDWWKEVIRKKYIRRPRSKMMDSAWTGKGTTLWQLCKASINIIKEQCYWIPGNGQRINIWTSRILGQPPISSLPGLAPLAEWASGQGIQTIYDLSLWDTTGQWRGWKELTPPAHMANAASSLRSRLHGLSPS